MFIASRGTAPVRELEGLCSHVLLQAGDVAESELTVTWVDVEPGSGQQPHSHDPEQVYVIVRGCGRMRVDGEEREVQGGDLVHIPPATTHSIENTGEGMLTYVSAATPAFSITGLYDAGQLARPPR